MESFYEKYKSFDWDDEISSRLTSYRNATQQGEKDTCEWCTSSHRYFSLERQKCIEAQQRVIIFGSVRQAENQLKTYLMSPHMLNNNTPTKELCYNGQKLFTKPMMEHFPTTEDTLTWKYHA
jgi:hypothetical protein